MPNIRSIKDNNLIDEPVRNFGIEFSRLDMNNAEMRQTFLGALYSNAAGSDYCVRASSADELDEL